jgi:hypothetical protein
MVRLLFRGRAGPVAAMLVKFTGEHKGVFGPG